MLALLGMTTSSISAQAAESQSNNTYQQNERMGISSTTLSAGETINIIDNDGMAFYVPGGAKISFTLVWKHQEVLKWDIKIQMVSEQKSIVEQEKVTVPHLQLEVQDIINSI